MRFLLISRTPNEMVVGSSPLLSDSSKNTHPLSALWQTMDTDAPMCPTLGPELKIIIFENGDRRFIQTTPPDVCVILELVYIKSQHLSPPAPQAYLQQR